MISFIRLLNKKLTGLSVLCLTMVMVSCSPTLQRHLKKQIHQTESIFQDHTGFILLDPASSKVVFQHKADRYFTPASNTKILTLFSCFTILGDSIPAIKYLESGDSLIFWGTGDPSFLYSKVYSTPTVVDFLRNNSKPLYFSTANFHTTRFGSGWAWDDYAGAYQPERSALPMYGNLLTATLKNNVITVQPPGLSREITIGTAQKEAEILRDEYSNKVVFRPAFISMDDSFEVPFFGSDSLTRELLQDTLLRTIKLIPRKLDKQAKTLYSVPVDSVYKVMMQESDNLIAEQLLMQCSMVLSDSLKPEIAITFMQRNQLADLPDKLKWVDGSGLSRYNLVTPRSIAMVWKKLYDKVPAQRLLPLLATGGANGTVKNWYKADTPYIFGKTGSLANNHCLSGYLKTRSGKTLIFSFMNSNYLASTSAIRRNMQEIFEYIREKYK
jgi:serine-type D-Ala-D-Ala carboxypeptidase/endopeptidase (penicillin-binding protein 4)